MNDITQGNPLQERSDFYLALARAFLAPQTSEHHRAICDFLADDLEDLGRLLGYDIGREIGALRGALMVLGNHEDMLVAYSRMFLQPPREASLNTCIPIDGAVMGGTVQQIEDYYREFGVERGEHFKDLPDHVSVQLEFLAYLFGQAAARAEGGGGGEDLERGGRHFLFRFVSAWVPHLALAIERAGTNLALAANPWLPLVRILAAATEADAAADPERVEERKRVDIAIEKARREYAAKGITPEAMAEIERKLKEKGLATDHLEVALERRNAALGLSAKAPPDPRRK